jgi:hypothetical protein
MAVAELNAWDEPEWMFCVRGRVDHAEHDGCVGLLSLIGGTVSYLHMHPLAFVL